MSSDATIKDGSTLKDCLKKFFAAELVENYFCNNCWHAAAIGYVSALREKTDVETLQRCNKNDSCECKTLPSLQAFPWSNRFSRTFKQLSIAQSPKILCIHLQRASYNMFGQSVKLWGHVSFPSILDLSSFVSNGVGLKNTDSNSRFGPLKLGSNELCALPYSKYQNMLINAGMRNSKTSSTSAQADAVEELARTSSTSALANAVEELARTSSTSAQADAVEELARTSSTSAQADAVEELARTATMVNNGVYLKPSEASPSLCVDGKVGVAVPPSAPPQDHQTYRLVSVVEHFGTSGGGHYTVYRKATAQLGEEDPVVLLESAIDQWFCISDSEVHVVSEKDVMGANASMLFYEKIGDS